MLKNSMKIDVFKYYSKKMMSVFINLKKSKYKNLLLICIYCDNTMKIFYLNVSIVSLIVFITLILFNIDFLVT